MVFIFQPIMMSYLPLAASQIVDGRRAAASDVMQTWPITWWHFRYLPARTRLGPRSRSLAIVTGLVAAYRQNRLQPARHATLQAKRQSKSRH